MFLDTMAELSEGVKKKKKKKSRENILADATTETSEEVTQRNQREDNLLAGAMTEVSKSGKRKKNRIEFNESVPVDASFEPTGGVSKKKKKKSLNERLVDTWTGCEDVHNEKNIKRSEEDNPAEDTAQPYLNLKTKRKSHHNLEDSAEEPFQRERKKKKKSHGVVVNAEEDQSKVSKPLDPQSSLQEDTKSDGGQDPKLMYGCILSRKRIIKQMTPSSSFEQSINKKSRKKKKKKKKKSQGLYDPYYESQTKRHADQNASDGGPKCTISEEHRKVWKDLMKECRENARPYLVLDDAAKKVKYSSDESPGEEVYLFDVQEFLSYFLLTDQYHCISMGKIANLGKCVQGLVVVVDGVSWEDYVSNDSELKNFVMAAKLPSPESYGGSTIWELSNHYRGRFSMDSGLTSGSFNKGSKSLRRVTSIESKKDVQELKDTVKWVEDCWKSCTVTEKAEPHPHSQWKSDAFPRTHLMLNTKEMISNGYPLPGISPDNFVMSLSSYAPVTNSSPIYGVDCEMCLTIEGNELTRVSIVNENEEVVYERLVKPHNPIRNYVTRFSGITPQMMEGVTTRLEDVQRELASILPPDVILVGQSLNFDLNACKMIHPYVIDTSCCFNMSGDIRRKTKLKILAENFLSWRIQREDRVGHDSIEDSIAAMRLVRAKLGKYYEWGNATLDFRNEEEKRKAYELLLERDQQPREVIEIKYASNAITDSLNPHPSKGKHNKRPNSDVLKNTLKQFQSKKQGSNDSTNFFQKLCAPTSSKVWLLMREEPFMDYWRYLPLSIHGGWTNRIKSAVEKNDVRALRHMVALAREWKRPPFRNLYFTHLKATQPTETLSMLSDWLTTVKTDCPDTLVCVVLTGRKGHTHGGFFSHVYGVPPQPPPGHPNDPRVLERLAALQQKPTPEGS